MFVLGGSSSGAESAFGFDDMTSASVGSADVITDSGFCVAVSVVGAVFSVRGFYHYKFNKNDAASRMLRSKQRMGN